MSGGAGSALLLHVRDNHLGPADPQDMRPISIAQSFAPTASMRRSMIVCSGPCWKPGRRALTDAVCALARAAFSRSGSARGSR